MQDLTKGPILGNVLRMGGFMLVSMVFQTLYFLVDLYFVGQLGKAAVAGVSVSGNLTFIVLAASQMLGVGTTALVAQATGRQDRAEARLIFNQSQVLALLVGCAFLVVMLALRGAYARGLGADAATAQAASDYLGWFVPAMALQFAMVTVAAALRGTGNFKPGMVIQSASVLLNTVLAPFLILGVGTGRPLGVAGAGLASFISIALGVLALLAYVVRSERYLVFSAASMKPRFSLWARLLRIGLPAGAEFAIMSAYMLIVYAITRRFGAHAQAGFGIGLRLVQAGFLPVVALGFAVGPVAGQNFGARNAERVRETFRVSAALAAGLMLVFTLVCNLVPGPMLRIFTSDPAVIAVGTEYLRIISLNNIPSGIIFVSSSMFQGMGNTWPSLASSLLRITVFAAPALWLASLAGLELRWIWYLSAASVLLQMLSNLYWLRREFGRRLAFASPPAASPAPAG